jgi:hypothetical protein
MVLQSLVKTSSGLAGNKELCSWQSKYRLSGRGGAPGDYSPGIRAQLTELSLKS